MGSKVRQLRRGRGLSQAQLAEVLGCRQAWISKVESGASRTSPAQLRSLCLVLGVSADYLLSL
jgi:transcriptional regulator with XRE-family HTH domain